jgi:Na+/melibiose symporter-like transporter
MLATTGLNTALTINDQQPETALSTLHFALFLLPAIMRAIQIVLLFIYPLTRDKYAKVLEDIRIRNEARSAAAEATSGDGQEV